MSEDERTRLSHEDEQDEVEAHRKSSNAANEEPAAEGDDDDVEAHRSPKNV